MACAMLQQFNDPGQLVARIVELVNAKRQFAVAESHGTWQLSYGGPSTGRVREDGKIEVIE